MAAGIYIHIPFCLRKCYYCDFYSKAIDDKDLRAEYTTALLYEIAFYGQKYGKDFEADSIFFGGGTPSLMEPELIEKIISALKKNFSIADDAEITMEANPATLTRENLIGYKAAGVNRLSIGAQSFDEDVLKSLGRIHTKSDIKDTVALARKAGFNNINLDLMFAVPELGSADWKKTVNSAASLHPEHISFYSLEIAEGTLFGNLRDEGKLKETNQCIDRLMYHNAIKILKRRGYELYEISNASVSGKECKHNEKYWHFEDYLGLGASSHGFVKGVRYSNIDDLDEYIKRLRTQDNAIDGQLGESEAYGAACVDSYHINSYWDNVSEYVFTGLRTVKGVNLEDFKKRFKNDFWDVYGKEREAFEEYVKEGYAISDDEHIALTIKGMDISNSIMAIFV